jgi:hypothetical protein
LYGTDGRCAARRRLAQFVQLARQQDQSGQQCDECQHHRQLQTQEYASFHDSSRSLYCPALCWRKSVLCHWLSYMKLR